MDTIIPFCSGVGTETPLLDSAFVATLYTSDADKMMRYNDEGETTELCKWTVDLSSLPTFHENAAKPQANGFYTGRLIGQAHHYLLIKGNFALEFELGLELDSAEVRGILVYNNQEWGRFASCCTYTLLCVEVNVSFTGLRLTSWVKVIYVLMMFVFLLLLCIYCILYLMDNFHFV